MSPTVRKHEETVLDVAVAEVAMPGLDLIELASAVLETRQEQPEERLGTTSLGLSFELAGTAVGGMRWRLERAVARQLGPALVGPGIQLSPVVVLVHRCRPQHAIRPGCFAHGSLQTQGRFVGVQWLELPLLQLSVAKLFGWQRQQQHTVVSALVAAAVPVPVAASTRLPVVLSPWLLFPPFCGPRDHGAAS